MPSEIDLKRLVLVTGPSGAGRTTAIRSLEDFGFEVIDNMPLSLVSALIDAPNTGRPLALGVDVRNRDFSIAQLIEVIDDLGRRSDLNLEILYLDCEVPALVRRFSETRRRHPMAPEGLPSQGVARELDLMVPIKTRADILIDTTTLSPHGLKSELARWFASDQNKQMVVSIQSFSYKRGLPRSIDMMFDCRFLNNPHWNPDLRVKTGKDSGVKEFVEKDALYGRFFEQSFQLIDLVLPAHAKEGRSHVSIGFGCTGGQHRSVALAEAMFEKLSSVGGWHLSVRHRELERALAHQDGTTKGLEAK